MVPVHQKKTLFVALFLHSSQPARRCPQKVAPALPGLAYCPLTPRLPEKRVESAPRSLGTSVTLLSYSNFGTGNIPEPGQSSTPSRLSKRRGRTAMGFPSPSGPAPSFAKTPTFTLVISSTFTGTMGGAGTDVAEHVSCS